MPVVWLGLNRYKSYHLLCSPQKSGGNSSSLTFNAQYWRIMYADNNPCHAFKWMQLQFTRINVFLLFFVIKLTCFSFCVLIIMYMCMFIVCFWKGKGENIWDRWTHEGGHIFNNDTGDIACDSYHKYKDDVQLLKDMGVSVLQPILSVWWTFPDKKFCRPRSRPLFDSER